MKRRRPTARRPASTIATNAQMAKLRDSNRPITAFPLPLMPAQGHSRRSGIGPDLAKGPRTQLHYAPNQNLVGVSYVPAQAGFNLADVSSVNDLSYLPGGVLGLVFLGLGNGADSNFINTVTPFLGNPKVYGFYLYDDPDPSVQTPANLKAESDWIHTNFPGAKTFIFLLNQGTLSNPSFGYSAANTDIDLFGLGPYPVRAQFSGGVDYNLIYRYLNAALAAGIPLAQIVPVYQAFGNYPNQDYRMPSPDQLRQILITWGQLTPAPAFDYAYSWGSQLGDIALVNSTDLQAVMAQHNSFALP